MDLTLGNNLIDKVKYCNFQRPGALEFKDKILGNIIKKVID